MGTRRVGRIAAFQALYAWEETSVEPEHLLKFNWLEHPLDDEARFFAGRIVEGTLERLEEIDSLIQRHLKSWSFERLNRVDLALLRTSTHDLVFQKEIPALVTIDEAVEIAKKYGAPDSYRFVNGVLDGIKKGIAADD